MVENFFYAQIDDNRVCYGVSSLAGEINDSRMIRLESNDFSIMGKKLDADGVTWIDVLPPLDQVKNQKLAELKAHEDEGLKTFKSSALGTEQTYLTRDALEWNMWNGEYSYVKGDDYDGLPITWYTVESGNTDHTKAQFVQAFLDGMTNVKTVKYHRATLEPQVNAATTIDEVNAIVW